MSFIRKKSIANIEYAYLVTNRWTSKGSRQKAKYLGKVLRLDIVKEIPFNESFISMHNMNFEEFCKSNSKEIIVEELVKYELIKRGFSSDKVRIKGLDESYLNNKKYYLKDSVVLKITTGKEAILEMNEGFLCRYSIGRLLSLKLIGYDEREKGILLAKALLEAGLKVEKELFVHLFEKWDKI